MSQRPTGTWRQSLRPALILAFLAIQADRAIQSHDGHAPLPSKGATVQGIQLLLSEPARNAIGVEVGKVTLADLDRQIRAQGHVQLPWHQQALVTTLVPGRIEKALARPGEVVEKGQILALIESLELETIQRELLKAISEKSLAERLLEQREELGRSNTIPLTTILETRRDVNESSARVEVAIRKLMSLGLTEADLRQVMESRIPIRSLAIRSPIRGEIESVNVRAGQVVATDEHLFHLVDLSEVEVLGEVLESDLPYVTIGQPVKASFTSLPGQDFTGVIEHTKLAINPKFRTLSVIVHVENPNHALKPGMSGLMSIQVTLAKQAIVCPSAAISGSPDAPFVFLERAAGRFDRRAVKTGSRVGNQVEVLDGLFPGDRVVVTGTGLLTALFPQIRSKPELGLDLKISQESIVQTIRSKPMKSEANSEIIAQGEVETPVDQRHFASSQVEGRIARILVHPGEEVKAGQVLAEVESLPLHNLQLDLLQTKARLKWTLEKTVRLRDLHERQVTSRVDLWKSETELEVTEQSIAEIKAKLRSLGLDQATLEALEAGGLDPNKRFSSTTIPIRAPAKGRLDHFEVVPGQVVRPSGPGQTLPSEPLFEIHDRAKLWVCAHVRERDASRLRTGLAATVTFPEMPGKSVKGAVVRISPVFDPQARVIPVWIEVGNADGRLYEKMQARALIELDKPDKQASQNPK